jgi:catechol 2,3-dioxygenase-like lactoylglutathione lyase family enzyme
MAIERIIPGICSRDLVATRAFYCGLLGLVVGMEEDDFLLLGSPDVRSAQLVVNDNGHPGLPPGFAVDVGSPERVRAVHDAVLGRGLPIVEPLTDKPWGIRRFSVVDPNGVRVTVIAHTEPPDADT